MLGGGGNTVGYFENAAPQVINSALTLGDADSTTLTGATVTIGAGRTVGDILGFTNQNGITGSYDAATGVLTLTGTASLANYQTALRSVTFSSTSDNPTNAARTISFVANDGAGTNNIGTPVTSTVSVTPVNDAPSGSDNGATVLDNAVLTFTAASFSTGFSDVDGNSFAGVRITTLPTSGGTLRLNGVAVAPGDTVTLAQLNAGQLTFTPAAGSAGTAPSFTFQVQDNGGTANGGVDLDQSANTFTVQVDQSNLPPAVDLNGAAAGTGNSITIDEQNSGFIAPNATVTDSDSANFDTGTLTVSYGAAGTAQDAFGISDEGGMFAPGDRIGVQFNNIYYNTVLIGTFTSGLGAPLVVTFNANATPAAVQRLTQRLIAFNNSDTPPTVGRNATVTITDGDGGTGSADISVTITSVNDAPTLAGSATPASYTENGTGVAIASGITVSDPDSTTLSGATVTINGGRVAGDTLGFTNQNGITGSYDPATGILTLSGTASVAAYQAALRTITFSSTSENPTAACTIAFVVNDGASANSSSAPFAATVNVTPVNDAPAGANATVSATEDTRQVVTAANFGFTDVDGDNFAAVRISSVPGGGSLYLDTDGAGGSLGTLLVAGAEVTAAQIAAGQLVYVPNTDVNGTDSFTFQVRDDGGTANGGVDLDQSPNTLTLNVAAVNDAPVLAGGGNTVAYVENGTPLVIDSTISLSDVDSTTLTGATIRISSGFNPGDYLDASLPNGFSLTYFTTTGVLTVSGTASLATYQAILRSVTFFSTSDNPTAAPRTISFVANDGGGANNLSNAVTSTVTVTPVNDAPAGTNGSVAVTEDTRQVLTAANFGFTDVDGHGFDAVRIATAPTGGSLYLDTDGAGGSLGQLLVAGDIVTIAAINAGQLVYVPAPNANGTASFTFQVRDDGGTLNGGVNLDPTPNTLTFNIAAVNDAPMVGLSSIYNATEQTALNLKGSITVADADAANGVVTVTLTSGTTVFGAVGLFTVTAGTSGATVSGNNSPQVTITGTLAQINALLGTDATSTVTFTPVGDSPPASTTITVAIKDNGFTGQGGPLTASGTATVNIAAVDDPAAPAADTANVLETGTVNIAVLANDTDPDGGPGSRVVRVNGSAIAVGGSVTLASGAIVTLNSDGTLGYNPNGAYYYLVSPQTAAATGAADGTAQEVFTYSTDGTNSASVTVTITGVDNPGSELRGDAGNNTITGTPQPDLFNLSQGGNDTVSGGEGNDGFYFGNTLTAQDGVDGQGGTLDQIGLQGNYVNLILGPNTIRNVENIVLLSGRSTAFGAPGNQLFTYNITSNNASIAAGQTLSVSANQLVAGESSTFNASGETDGILVYYGGFGTDNVIGGQQNDGFFFGEGAFGAGDVIDGQGGNLDQLALQGNYTLTFGFGQLMSVENLVLISASDIRFPSTTDYTYNITLNNGNVAAGGLFAVSANSLTTGENLTLDARSELDASITVFSGAGDDRIDMGAMGDRVFGGAGADLIYGNGGGDQLTGGAGNDIFAYRLVSDSTATAQDRILDFTTGDKIDLSAIGSFTLIGGNSFTAANQVRITDVGNGNYLVQAETNGDGQADMSILVTSDHMPRAGDFNGFTAASASIYGPSGPADMQADAVSVSGAGFGIDMLASTMAGTGSADLHDWHGTASAGLLDLALPHADFG